MKAKGNAPVISSHCDACGSSEAGTEVKRIEGVDVRICVAQGPCIARAKAAGTWKQVRVFRPGGPVVPGRSEP